MMVRFRRWMDEGYLSSNGSCFDIGGTVNDALRRFKVTGEPFSGSTDRFAAGNGCLMRLAPVPMFFHPDLKQVIERSGQSSRLTHGAQECVEATRLFGAMLFRALSGETKEAILGESGLPVGDCESVVAIAAGTYRRKPEDEIRGSGYVVDSLEAALWCFANTATFEEAILRAANLGDDADTTAAICGQLAGAHYGMAGIPQRWLDTLVMRDEIRRLADKLARLNDVQ
jgi:ADP-ribosyl-[dinitrogen reductase] hydrolase